MKTGGTKMKVSFLKAMAIAMLIGLLGCDSKKQSVGGDGVGNGGDAIAMEFRLTAEHAISRAETNDINMYNLNYQYLRNVLKNSNIVTTNTPLTLNGDEKDALNFPSTMKIKVNRSRFSSYTESLAKEALALHEVFGLAGISDAKFEKSSRLIGYDPLTRRIVMDKVDILFVIDDSGSMAIHQSDLSAHIDYFVKKIENEKADYHIGVITTSWDSCSRPGMKSQCGAYLHSKDPLLSFVTPFALNGSKWLRDNLLVGTWGDGNEMPFGALNAALTNPILNAENKDFYRDDARLEVVIVTDAQEQSALSASDMVTFLSGLKNGDIEKVGLSLFLPLPGDASCAVDWKSNDADYYGKYFNFLTPFHGGLYNLCTTLIKSEVAAFSEDVTSRISQKSGNIESEHIYAPNTKF
jgi:hypothetical protein